MRRAFTLIELIITVFIVVVLISLLLTGLSSVRSSRDNIGCLSNLRQLVTSFHAYIAQPRAMLPETFIHLELNDSDVVICPADRLTRPGYSFTIDLVNSLQTVASLDVFITSRVPVYCDNAARHPHVNAAYFDGHADRMH